MEVEVEIECPTCGEIFTTIVEIEIESCMAELD